MGTNQVKAVVKRGRLLCGRGIGEMGKQRLRALFFVLRWCFTSILCDKMNLVVYLKIRASRCPMSRLKLLLMSKEAFWKVRAKLSRGLFYIRKAFYSASSFMNKQRTNISIQLTLVFQTIKKLILAAFLLFIACVLDHLIFDIFGLINPLSTLNQQILSDVLIAALSISGIFLGLYFSNMTSVYSSRYANAPARVRQLFENEVVTSNSINDIILFIVISIVALLISMFGLVLKPITICFLFFLSIKNIVSFALIGKRSFQFSDVFEITTPIFKNIRESYKSATYKGLFYKDINFQAHYQKNTRSNLEVLSVIATYNIECDLPPFYGPGAMLVNQ
jgi:hypothetical protein